MKKQIIKVPLPEKPRNPFGTLSPIMKKGGSHAKDPKAIRQQEKIKTREISKITKESFDF